MELHKSWHLCSSAICFFTYSHRASALFYVSFHSLSKHENKNVDCVCLREWHVMCRFVTDVVQVRHVPHRRCLLSYISATTSISMYQSPKSSSSSRSVLRRAMASFQIVSDLHLEVDYSYETFEIQPKAPYLALLGDIRSVKHDGLFSFLLT